ncbi:flagellar basal body-associated FliL family protein [Citreimonas sp.]|uniref:flagellar basal body-associated FliL family protein n=1 Tax=Citreimonas sp. TaxID=3036715 RepID=UPI0035C869D6
MVKLLPLILLIGGIGAGVGAGLAFAPSGDAETPEHAAGDEHGEAPAAETAIDCGPQGTKVAGGASDMPPEGREYAKMSNQFVIPVISNDKVTSLVVASLSLEVGTGVSETVFAREPKLRDAFLRVFLDHASIGGFDGNFTAATRLASLRTALLESTRPVMGNQVSDVLITELARQDS